MSKAKVATVWLDGCSGCHMSLLDIDDALVDLLEKMELAYSPLVDAQEFPEDVDVTVVEGAVSTQDDLKLVQTIRKRTRTLVALGDCAVTANVPSMRNWVPVNQLLQSVYGAGDGPAKIPHQGVPPLLKKAVPVHEVVKVDLEVPGCPPQPATILRVVRELLEGKKPKLAGLVKFG